MQGLITLIVLGIIAFTVYLVKEHFREKREHRNAKDREEKYWSEIEPKYKEHKKYPPDWQIRRAFVYFRESGYCEKCKKLSGSINKSKLDFWYNPYVHSSFARFVRGSHVHHITPISAGGNHDLNNLQLLCEDCHDREHPEKGLKKSLQRARSINSLDLSHESKVTKARKDWSCEICRDIIQFRSYYFGDAYTKICMQCYTKYKKTITEKASY